MKERSNALESIPGVGKSIAADLRSIGIVKVGDLKNQDPEQLYNALQSRVGAHIDRCVLYVFRCAVYYASHRRHDPKKLKWWNWKDTGQRNNRGRTPNQALQPTVTLASRPFEARVKTTFNVPGRAGTRAGS